jgi:hypothetical protein
MDSREALLWLVAAAFLVALAGYALTALRGAAKRRARLLHYQRAGYAVGPASTAPDVLSGSIGAGQAEAVRRHAERSAARDWRAGNIHPMNPYGQGSAEYVLWITTYHLTMTVLTEEAEPAAAAAAPQMQTDRD